MRRKITSWILLVAMLLTVMPTSLVFAYSDKIEASTASMTRDHNNVKDGTDFPLLYHGEFSSDFKGSIPADIIYLRRGQDFIIRAESELGQFYDEFGNVPDGTLQFAYLNDKEEALKLDETNGFKLEKMADPLDVQWIDINSNQIQHTPSNLSDFWTKDSSLDKKKVTVSEIATADHVITAHLFNALGDQFAGYILVKYKDNLGSEKVEKFPIIADGQYPGTGISMSTEKLEVGGATAISMTDAYIASTDYEFENSYADYVDSNENSIVPYVSLRHPELKMNEAENKEELLIALENADADVWTSGDVTIDKIIISDKQITSGIASVEFFIDNIEKKDDIAIDTRDASGNRVSGAKEVVAKTVLNVETDLAQVDDTTWEYAPASPIVIANTNEGMNALTVVVKDKAGLKKTDRYYFFIDKTAPEAKFSLNKTEKNVAQLFSDADIVTNRELTLDLSESADVSNGAVTLISKFAEIDKNGENVTYRYRLLAKDDSSVGVNEDADTDLEVPAGYSKTAPANTNLTYGEWIAWTGSADLEVALTPIIDEEFDGLVQVSVQDRAGNWSKIVSVTENGEETIITDNTNAEIEVKVYENDGDAATIAAIEAGTATDILDTTGRIVDPVAGDNENETITTITGDEMPWINDSAVLEVKITDADLANAIRSSGLSKGEIVVSAEYHDANQNKEVKIWKRGATAVSFTDEITISPEYLFNVDIASTDKAPIFYIEYEGTGVVDITVSIKDQADVNDSDDFTVIYKLQLKVDKINPYFEFKGYDIKDANKADLLKENNATPDANYLERNMPWGPNSQVLEVVAKDNYITDVQSGVKTIKFKADKSVDLYNGRFAAVASYAPGVEIEVPLSECEKLANENYESNVAYKFYLVYEGTGIAKIDFYTEDVAGNIRDFAENDPGSEAYDAKLRVDKINPEIKNLKLVQQATDVNDGFMLFTVNQTQVDVNTRKQMSLSFEIDDAIDTVEQAGPNIQNEEFADIDLMDVYEKYVESDKTHLYDDEAVTYATDDVNDEAIDPNIDYILIPVELGEVDGLGGEMVLPAADDNDAIEAWVNEWIAKWDDAEGIKVEWQNKAWEDGAIVVPDEFQGAIVVRTIDRVGNVDYAAPITFVAESRDPLIDFDPQNGYIWSQNNYGWSKREYDYVEIRVKDTNVEKVDAWLENVFIQVTDLEGNDISTKDTVKYAYPKIHADNPVDEVDPSGYTYVGLDEFTAEALYGYDVISKDGLVEKLARDDEGYIHLGFVRVEESAQIKVTIFDKAKYNDAEYTGNKTTGIWTSRIDRVAPIVTEFDLVPLYEGKSPEDNNNNFALKIAAEDALSGLAPYITDAEYNVYTPENIPVTGVFAPGVDTSYLYRILDDTDTEIERYESGTFNKRQYELPGLQYALIPRNGFLDDVDPWDFETAPDTTYDENGYNGEMGKPYVWHNYVDETVPVLPEQFDGLIVVRAIDKAGNITVIGYSSILDVEADDDWNNETQFIQVRTDNKWTDGVITNVEYYGNNNLLFPADMRKDLSNSLNNGEGAIIEVAEEGITNVVITATEEFVAPKTEKAKADDEAQKRDSDWEGEMYLGNLTAAGYNDWKFQVVDVKIDKTNPEFGFKVVDENGNIVTDEAVKGALKVKLTEIFDPIPNINENDPLPETKDEWYYASHIPSDIAKVEWCAVPEGSDEEKWEDANDWKNLELGVFDATDFTGTIKVRVTDNAGNVTEKSQRINVDGVEALINLSKSHDDIYSIEPVDVFVTVTENAEFSDISKVTYVVTDEDGNVVEEDKLTLIGGTVSVDREGTSTVTVTAETKAGVTASESIVVKIDMSVPTFDMDVVDSFGSVKDRATNEAVTIKATNVADAISGVDKVEYAVIPEGSSEVNYNDMTVDGSDYVAPFDVDDAFTGTVNVRVTDVAGHITVKSMKINIDKKAALVVISNPTDENNYATAPVDVFVTVTANAEYSDVAEVTYTVNGADAGSLALTGGTIKVAEEGITTIVVTAKTKAGVEATAETVVYIDKTAPTFDFDAVDSADNSVLGGVTNSDVTLVVENIVEDGSGIKAVEYAVIPEGTTAENFGTMTDNGSGKYTAEYLVADAFTGTFKVRVTDEAGHVTVESTKIHIDKKAPIVVISNPTNENDYSTENVDVVVNVTADAEYSDVKAVTYTVNGGEDKILALNGGTISITEEGKSEIKVTAVTKADVSYTATTTVYIDKTAPAFDLTVKDSNGSVEGKFTDEAVTINAENIVENGSGVKAVEYAVIPEGSLEENYAEFDETAGVVFDAEAFTGTVKVRVTDNAGNVTVKSMRINIDKTPALIVATNKTDADNYSVEAVDVFVTVTENAEFSDVAEVTYTVNGADAGSLALTGGTIKVAEEGITTIVVTAKTKAGVEETATTTVYIDKTAPTFDLKVEDGAGSVEDRATNEAVAIKAENIVENGSGVKAVEYAVIPEGSLVENYAELEADTTFDAEAFTGTVKVRVTDNAGNVTVKSMKINIDKTLPLVVISKSNEADYSKENVNVFVTVTENAEYSDVASVTYTVNGVEAGSLALTGGTISVTEEGTTKIVVTATNKAGDKATAETTVLIDKTAPTFDFDVVDASGNTVADKTTKDDVTIKVTNAADAISGVAKIEYTVVPEGSDEENYEVLPAAGYKLVVTKAFTGTVKVRVTDNAGHVTIKSMKIDIDKATPIISASKSYETTCASGPVEVYVTVSETAEFSDVASVTYTVDGGAAKNLPLIGGVISVDKEGKSVIKITATNKAGVSVTETVNVTIHHGKLAMPVIEGVQPGSWKTSNSKVTVVYAGSETVYYSLNGSDWKVLPADKKIALVKGANKILLQARSTACACVSDINTYDINFDAGNPIVELDYSSEWTNETATIAVAVNRGACESDVKKVTYDLTKKGGATEKGKLLTVNGGTIVITEEGEWTVSNITVEMVSGIKYTHTETATVKIDKSAPVLNFELKDTADLAQLFGMADVNSKYQQQLEATATDALSNVDADTFEYAVLEKGILVPTWNKFNAGEKPVVITKAFDGTVLVRVADKAGNYVTASKTVFTEGIAPEISITAPSEWINTDARMFISVVDKGLSSAIATVTAAYYDGEVVDEAKKLTADADMVEALTSEGGTIDVKREGITTVAITATDVAGNVATQTFTLKIDKTAPTYTGFTNGYVYNYDITMDDVTDNLSGIAYAGIQYVGDYEAPVRENIQSSYKFSESGFYTVTLIDNAGNVTTASFEINKSLKYVINVVEVDENGRVKVEVLDGSFLTFYQKANGASKFTSMEITHDSVWIEKTGVYYINAKDDKGNTSNTLYIVVAPTKGINPDNVGSILNRDVTLNVEDENVTITKIREIFKASMSDVVYNGSVENQPVVELFDDGVYNIVNN